MWRAVKEGRQQCAIFTEFTAALEDEDADVLKAWKVKVEKWEAAPSKRKNPYDVKKKSTSPIMIHIIHILTRPQRRLSNKSSLRPC